MFLSNLAQILTSCSKMNDKSTDIRSISQCTEVYFILITDEKHTISLQKFCSQNFNEADNYKVPSIKAVPAASYSLHTNRLKFVYPSIVITENQTHLP